MGSLSLFHVVIVVAIALAAIGFLRRHVSSFARQRGGVDQGQADAGSPQFEVGYADGVPDIYPFLRTVPLYAERYGFSYSNDYAHEYAFEAVEQEDESYAVFILRRPSYTGRAADGHATHRYDIGTAWERICFSPEATAYDAPDACRKAVMWADLTSRYIVHNERF